MLCEQCYILFLFIKYNMLKSGTNKERFNHSVTEEKKQTGLRLIDFENNKNAHRNISTVSGAPVLFISPVQISSFQSRVHLKKNVGKKISENTTTTH